MFIEYVAQGETPLVYLIHCAIDELQQNPHSLFVKFTQLLFAYGLCADSFNATIMQKTISEVIVILVVCVDDIFWIGRVITRKLYKKIYYY